MDANQVASIVGVSPRVASRWIKRYQETGEVECLPKPGRKHALNEAAQNEAYNLLYNEWEALGNMHARNLVLSATRRVAKCIALDGKRTGY